MFGLKFKAKSNDKIDERHIHKIVDFTCISPLLTKKELEKLMCVAYKNKYYSFCINPVNVKYAQEYNELKFKSALQISTVIGFPLGETTVDAKVYEIKKALLDGADELDVVITISRVKMGDYGYIKNEISRIVKAAKKHVVKIIVETSYLNKQELAKVCSICAKYKVDYIQTSTGFAGGATIEDVETIKSHSNNRYKVKASGGIETNNQGVILMRAGAERIGTSREI